MKKLSICFITGLLLACALCCNKKTMPLESISGNPDDTTTTITDYYHLSGRVRTVKQPDGSWQLTVDGSPYFIKGVLYDPTKIGEGPGIGNDPDWMTYDANANGLNDMAYDTWLDTNTNNVQDSGEEALGDFELLRQMGCNTVRFYHVPSDNALLGNIYRNTAHIQLNFDHAVDKTLLRQLYNNYGIMIVMGSYFGSWVVGSGTAYEDGCDYTDATQRSNIMKSVKAMVLDNKDEPYVLMWLLGNENNIADWSQCNAKTQPVAYATLLNEVAAWIHQADPDHPVAVCDGDDSGAFLYYYKQYAPNIDIIGYNAYRGFSGFNNLWSTAHSRFDRPVFVSEWGMFAYQNGQPDEAFQLDCVTNGWKDIVKNSSGFSGTGNSIGATYFDWLDKWWLDGQESVHNSGVDAFWISTPDGLLHEEWFGLTSMGNGSDSLMRQTRKSYDYFKSVWNNSELTY